jgi:hypothetical protein
MKGQRIRYQQTGEFHFLTFSCYRRQPYLAAVAAIELFEDALEGPPAPLPDRCDASLSHSGGSGAFRPLKQQSPKIGLQARTSFGHKMQRHGVQ